MNALQTTKHLNNVFRCKNTGWVHAVQFANPPQKLIYIISVYK